MSTNFHEVNKPKWCENIPEVWQLDRLKWCLSSVESGNRERGGGNLEGGVFSIGGEHISWSGELLLDNPKFISEDFYSQLNNGKIQPGDILLVKDGATIGKCAYIEEMPFKKCAVNEHVFILRSNEFLHRKFLYFFILSRYGQDQIYREIRGAAQGGLISSFVSEFLIPYPKYTEQKAIVNFLDRKISQIDVLISKNQRLIELLEEYRFALINQVVTKGLDPNVQMRESGIKWLGKIPTHWKSIKIKYLNSVIMGQSPSSDNYNQEKIGLPFLQGNADFTDLYPIPRVWCDTTNKKAKEGDVLLSVRAPVGAVNIADQEYGIGRGLCAIRADKTNSKFLFYVIKTLHDELNSIATGSIYKAISVSDIENSYIPHTTQTEQKAIVDYLDNLSEKIKSLILQIQRKIELLYEYKNSIISNTLTGKIDVRDWKEEENGIQTGGS